MGGGVAVWRGGGVAGRRCGGRRGDGVAGGAGGAGVLLAREAHLLDRIGAKGEKGGQDR